MQVLDQAVDYCRASMRKPGEYVVTLTFPGISFPRWVFSDFERNARNAQEWGVQVTWESTDTVLLRKTAYKIRIVGPSRGVLAFLLPLQEYTKS